MVAVSHGSSFLIALDRDSEEPIYRQLIRHIRAQVDSGSLPPGTRLPASRDLARQLGISRISVVNAYAELRAEGYLSAHAGRGTFVAGDHSEVDDAAEPRSDHVRPPAPVEAPVQADRSIREMMRLSRRPGVINFSHGTPPIEFLPVAHVKDAINHVLDRDGSKALTYEVPEGYMPLRMAVRDYVSALGIQASPEHILITGGTQQAIDLVVQAVVGENELVLTENPTYLGMIDIARTRRAQIAGVPMDDDGLRLDVLENMIIELRPRLLYVMPTFQNPTGLVMPLHRRRQLLTMALEYHVPILEDSVYHEFRYEGESLPPLKALDDDGIVIHVSGFTKNMLPGMRIGYVICDGRYFDRILRVKQAADVSTPGLNQRAIHLLLERGVLGQQIERSNRELRRRRDIAVQAAERHLPPGSRWRVPQGGLYLWVELPPFGPTAAELFIQAIQRNVAFAIGNVFHTNASGSYYIRINFGAHRPNEIEEGLRRLGQAWREVASDYADTEKTPLL